MVWKGNVLERVHMHVREGSSPLDTIRFDHGGKNASNGVWLFEFHNTYDALPIILLKAPWHRLQCNIWCAWEILLTVSEPE
jgi:hypothetical protein